MSITINSGKELAAAPRPVALVTITFPDGGVLRASTHNGDGSNGGYSYGGNAYLPLIEDEQIDALAQLSEQGIDRIPTAKVMLADPDCSLWTAFERASGKGLKGSTMQIQLVLHDPLTGDYSTDALVPFTGLCSQPEANEKNLVVSAAAKLNLTRYMLPQVPVQVRCPWVNPATVAQRADAASPDSPYYLCGETRDLTTAPPCANTKQTCTQPNRYGGVTWAPEIPGSGREYTSGNRMSWRNPDTSQKYSESWPLWLGGLAWMDLLVLNSVADGNYTRGEVAVAFGAVDIRRVIVNGTELSYAPDGRGDFRWHYVNNGARDGTPNGDTPYNGNGDPYGNLTAIQVLAPHSVIQPGSVPSVRVLAQAKQVRVYRRIVSASASGGEITLTLDGPNEDCAGNSPFTVTVVGCGLSAANGTHGLSNWTYGPPGTVTLAGTSASGSGTGGYLYYEGAAIASASAVQGASSPWPLLELLTQSRFAYAEVSVEDFADAAKICNAAISVTDQNGNTITEPRFSTAIALRQRRSAAEIVRGIRQAIGALLFPGPDGRLRLRMEGPLAEQQPSAVDGSNYNTAVSSKLRDGSSANGYAAYRFDESNAWGLRRVGADVSQMPNRVQFGFTDPVQGYATSTFAYTDSEDVARVSEEMPGGLQVTPEGIASYNHAWRAAKLGLAKIHRGNSNGDTRGTDYWEWTTSFRGCKLAIGQIVLLQSTRYGLSNGQVRVTALKPSRNFETIQITGHLHNDDWYLDSNGNVADPSMATRPASADRLPYAWQPYKEQPAIGDPLFARTEWTFGLQQDYEPRAGSEPGVVLRITGREPVTDFSPLAPPWIGSLGTTAASGGSFPGKGSAVSKSYYFRVHAIDADGKYTEGSAAVCRVDITAAGGSQHRHDPGAELAERRGGLCDLWRPQCRGVDVPGDGQRDSIEYHAYRAQ